jgi:hypothetical protein
VIVLFPLTALLGVFVCSLRSLGLGFVAMFAVGYFSGVIRANYLSIYTTFMFDAGILGLYLGFFIGRPRASAGVWATPAGKWIIALIAWPSLLVFLPINDFLVQLVALRGTVWFLPVMLVATRLRAADVAVIARGLAVLNLVALAGGVYVYRNGVEALYPNNAVTQIIYSSNDVAGYQYYRIPSFFLSAHAYGGSMVFSLPFLLGQLFGPKVRILERGLLGLGVAAAAAGVLMCAARQPAIHLVLVTLVAWVVSRFNPAIGVVAVVLMATAAWFATTSERLQRVLTLGDTELVSDRILASANQSFVDLIIEYPAGAGMGSSFGTSIPFFLADRAPQSIGLENEYSRILVDQGLLGLGLWIAFLAWLVHRPPPVRLGVPCGISVVLMFGLVVTNWATAFLGAGTLSAIPGSVMLLTQMGILARVRELANQGSA